MMRKMLLTSHWTPAEAYSLLITLRELQDALWDSYGEAVRQWLQEGSIEDHCDIGERMEDDEIPF